MKTKNKILNVISIALILSLLISFISSLYLNTKLKVQIHERDNTINILLKRDSIFNQIIDLKEDSTGRYEYFVTVKNNGKILTYNEMHELVDSMRNVVNNLSSNINNKFAINKEFKTLATLYNNLLFEYNIYKSALRNIQGNYGIKYKVDTISPNQFAVSLEHVNRIDSALAIFRHYRDRIIKIEYKNGAIISEIKTTRIK